MIKLLNKKLKLHCLLLCFFILITAISAGIFFGGIISGSDEQYFRFILDNSTVQTSSLILINITVLLLISVAGFTVYGMPLVVVILFVRSFAVGFCDYLLFQNIDSGNIPHFVFSFFLPQLILCLLYLLVSAFSVSYAFSQLHK